ncbi:MAG: hypothetical protein IT379_18355 [Deltaproteobacteria bacterium]|nr:hypothetical protein [Deltaproteobacteria bacterium]
MRLGPMLASTIALVAACSTDLGPCPDDPELEARGWLVLQRSCAGSTCHSTGATGTRRNGAPSGLDWDDPDLVRDDAGEVWAEIEGGSMPPEGWQENVPDAVLSPEDQEAIRALLACGVRAEALP